MTFEEPGEATLFLERKGYVIDKIFFIHAPRKPTSDELDAIDYLCDEWDYGYLGET